MARDYLRSRQSMAGSLDLVSDDCPDTTTRFVTESARKNASAIQRAHEISIWMR
jgi:hypothetical protein